MIEDVLRELKSRMDSSVNHTKDELNKVRTGRANPEMFNSLIVDYYGSKTPLNQVCTISVPENRLVTLTPFEKNLLPIIEKVISESNMGFSPGNNGTSVLVPIPSLSEERRKELIKFVHNLVEEGKIAVRNIRRDGIQQLNSIGKENTISEDIIKDNENEIQKITDSFVENLASIQRDKEKELLEV
jgi:ribosome recycling factor